MERVQFQQEQMLAELKDLAAKGLFTQAEVRQIMKKRTVFEVTLVRRVPRKGDFLRYAAYEMSLEALRRKRVQRLKLPKGPPSVSDYALVRRQFQIFERALKKFKEDVGLWIQYLQVAKREGARALVGRISARALQLHPHAPSLYILAASHELQHLSHASARVLLQRGLRLNSESIDLWREYLKMELGFVESLRRRWKVLGVEEASEVTGSGSLEKTAEVDSDEGANARREVLEGALARTVITNAVKECSTPKLFSALHSVIVTYPCPNTLRRNLHQLLHAHLQSSLSLETEPLAAKLHAMRYLFLDKDENSIVEGIESANKELSEGVRRAFAKGKSQKLSEGMAQAYIEFVHEWFDKDVDENLRLYLISSLQALCASSKSATLMLAHLKLLTSSHNSNRPSSEKLLKVAKKYSTSASTSSEIWLFRLDLEWELREAWEECFAEARQCVPFSAENDTGRLTVWTWILDRKSTDPVHKQIEIIEQLARDAMAAPSPRTLIDSLLSRYMELLRKRSRTEMSMGRYQSGSQVKDLERMAQLYSPSPRLWEVAFDIFSQESAAEDGAPPHTDSTIESPTDAEIDLSFLDETESTLRTVFTKWRLCSPEAHGDAAVKWASWLMGHGNGKEAADVVTAARDAVAGLGASQAGAFDVKWRRVLDNEDDAENDAGNVRHSEEDIIMSNCD